MASLNGITAQYNKKSSAVKRIMQEARELAREPSTDFAANPLESDIFEWHFTIRGPEGTEFEGGLYHGRILLPNNYPFAPPSLMFLTPNGRFELNKKVCLSITGYHPEYWQPAWGIRTVLVAVMGFLPTESKGAIGGLDTSVEARKALAIKSKSWKCKTCDMENVEILPNVEPDKAVKAQLKESEKADFSFGYEADKKPSSSQQEQQQQAATTDPSSTSSSPAEQSVPSPQQQKAAAAPDGALMTEAVEQNNVEKVGDANKDILDKPTTTTQSTDINTTALDVQETLAGTESSKVSGGSDATALPLDDASITSTIALQGCSAPSVPTVSSPPPVVSMPPRTPTPATTPATSTTAIVPPSSPSSSSNAKSAQSSPQPTPPQPSPVLSQQQQQPLYRHQPQQQTQSPSARHAPNQIPFWFDALIVGLGGILVALILRKIL
ncbi:hypothetical protein BGW41_001113 [Actinomortierella wolfii]|nr:hypothetical protein BGW41_001113 [Actinomortierella wolfii]